MLFTATIFSNAEIAPGYRRIRLSAPPAFTAAQPGQFVMVRVGSDPLLRRPFAVFDMGVSDTPDEALGGSRAWFEMLYKVVGKGTALLAKQREGTEIGILGPLARDSSAAAMKRRNACSSAVASVWRRSTCLPPIWSKNSGRRSGCSPAGARTPICFVWKTFSASASIATPPPRTAHTVNAVLSRLP